MTRLRLGYVCDADPRDRWSWSGTHYYMYNALAARGFDLVHVGRTLVRPAPSRLRLLMQRLGVVAPAQSEEADELDAARRRAAVLAEELRSTPCDILFAPVAGSSVAFLATEAPIAYLSDATFRLLRGYYPDITMLPPERAAQRDEIEARAIRAAHLLIYPSHWAAESAIRDYGAERDRVRVIPLGANVDAIPPLTHVTGKTRAPVCRLLFIGRDWERKGGEIALQTVAALDRLGVRTELTVCGSAPKGGSHPPHVRFVGNLDKKKPRSRAVLYDLLLHAHFLILPTRADCYSMVSCEANAFGIPVIITATGGIPSLVEAGRNGYTLPLEATGDDYARAIADAYATDAGYQTLVRQARATYDARLNWTAWGATMQVELETLAATRPRRIT